MGVLTSKLVISVLDRASGPARAIANSMKGMQASADRNRRELNRMQGQMLGAVGTGYILARSIAAPVKSAIEFESAMSDVKKVVDFDSPEGFKKMRKDIIDMSTRMPMTASQIADIVAAAGQAGMAGDELTQFAEMAAKVGVAFDVSAGTAGESLAKIKTALGLTVSETGELADAINHLSNTSASSAPDLLDFMRRVGSVGKQYGFTAEQTAAIGSAMIASGAQADVAATSFRNAGKALARGEGSTKRQHKAYKRLGLDAVKVSKNLQKDAVGTLKTVIGQIRELPKELQTSVISDLFGDEARAIAPLIENAELLDNALGSVASKAQFLGSSQAEFEERSRTSAAQLQVFQNKIEAASIAIGDSLLPVINDLTDALGPQIQAFTKWAEENPKILSELIKWGSVALGILIALAGLRYAFLLLKSVTWDLAAGIFKAFRKLSKLPGLGSRRAGKTKRVAGPAGAKPSSVKKAGVPQVSRKMPAAANDNGGGKSNIKGLKAGKLLKGAASLNLVGLILNEFEHSINTWGMSWKDRAQYAQNRFDAGAANGEAMNQWLEDLIGVRKGPVEKGNVLVEALKQDLALIDSQIAELGDSRSERQTKRGLQTDREEIVEQLKALNAELAQTANGVADAKVAEALQTKANQILAVPIPKPSAGSGLKVPQIAGARALGGQIVGGRNYLVGENGAELVTPSQSGYVHTASESAKMLGGGGSDLSSGETHYYFGPFYVDAASSASEMVEGFVEQVEDRMSGLHADREYAVR
ncbi:phage tail tape measure protein, TP901 family, core region [Pseudovibrio ascidiaceicola]|uniref:Phage tail tape measure protein, TP901 family, core region n=1 Tax=Pseudovibrio ascidiaceicola TaxID=285279 RepID=A0A1I4DZX6_9HYPH|nr:phage tail tape measure protein [Pseudovibrio ascidiaceicola]SFK99122.1 phage tail tape measure protein, TP901 family, core region [Pseudovibrio ascidiaceicola]